MLSPLMMLVFIAVVIALVVLAVRWLGGTRHGATVGPHPRADKTPIVILEERFASGAIDNDEFEERRRILSE